MILYYWDYSAKISVFLYFVSHVLVLLIDIINIICFYSYVLIRTSIVIIVNTYCCAFCFVLVVLDLCYVSVAFWKIVLFLLLSFFLNLWSANFISLLSPIGLGVYIDLESIQIKPKESVIFSLQFAGKDSNTIIN